MRITRSLTVAVASIGVAGTLAVVSAPVASAAAPTTTTITSYSGTLYRLENDINQNGTQVFLGPSSIKVTGTSDGTSGTVDIICTFGSGATAASRTLTTGVPVGADGTFSYTGGVDPISGRYCTLRAIPSGAVPADLSPFHGKLISVGENATYVYPTTSVNGGTTYDYYVADPQSTGFADYDSASSCGLADMALTDPVDQSFGQYLFYCNAYFWDTDRINTASSPPPTYVNQRQGLVIDGKAAELSYTAQRINSAAPAPGLTYSVTQDPATGDMVIAESEPTVFCNDPTVFPPTSTSCATYSPTGVRLDRTITQSHAGRIVAIRDTWVSTDGHSHALDLQYQNDLKGNAGHTTGVRVPWKDGSSFVSHAVADTFGAAPAGAGSIFMIYDKSASPSLQNPEGALTYSTPPSGGIFYGPNGFYLNYLRNVPAGGTSTLTQTYSMGVSDSEVQGYATTAASSSPPKLVLDPIPPTVGSRGLTVSGHVVTGGNGVPAQVSIGTPAGTFTGPVANDGTFAVPVLVKQGANALAVMVTDAGGLAASGSATVTFADPVSIGLPKVSKTRSGKKVTKLVLSDTVACASFAPVTGCTGTLFDKVGTKVLGKVNFHLAPGQHATMRISFGRGVLAAVNKLHKGKHLNTKVTATYNDPAGGTLTTAARSARLA